MRQQGKKVKAGCPLRPSKHLIGTQLLDTLTLALPGKSNTGRPEEPPLFSVDKEVQVVLVAVKRGPRQSTAEKELDVRGRKERLRMLLRCALQTTGVTAATDQI